MKKTIWLLSVALYLPILLLGQEITKEDIVKFKIKALFITDSLRNNTTVNYYNESGDIIMSGIKFPDYTAFTMQVIYNANKQLKEERLYTSKIELKGTINYYYNTQNQLIKKESFDGDNSIEFVSMYEYDNNGKITKTINKSANNQKQTTQFKYLNDKIIEEEIINDKKIVEKKIYFTYDEKELLIEKKNVNPINNKTTILKYNYNANAQLESIIEKSGEEVLSTVNYFYNEKGILEKTESKNTSGEKFNLYYQVEF